MTRYFGVVEAPINTAAAGIVPIPELPAPGVGFAWRILGFVLVAAAPVTVGFISVTGPTIEINSMNLIAGTPITVPMCVPGDGARWFTGVENNAIGLLMGGAIQVSGCIVAEKVPAGS
jgi:hypothetical protein